MQLLVFTAVALVALIVAVGIDLGGTLGVMLFLTIVLIGGIVRAWQPLIEWIRGPAAKL
jgi:hypothetical protein